MSTTTDLSTLKINYLTQAQYDEALEDGDINQNELYFTPDTGIKTINNESLIGSGNVAVQPTLVSGTNIKTVNSTSLLGSGDVAVQPTLVSGTSIKTVNSTSLLGSGDVAVQPTLVSGTNIKTVNSTSLLGSGDVTVQPTLVSGTNIKTVNNESLLGSGNVTIQGGASISTVQVSITVANWNATTTCTKSVTGVTASNSVIVSPTPASISDYVASGVYCSAQGAGTLTFVASSTPTANLTVNVMIVG